MDSLLLITSIIVVIAFAGWMNRRLSKRRAKPKETYAYRRKDYLMTRHERQFFSILHDNFGNEYHIFPQVHLSAVLDHKIKGQNWRAALAHIDRKSVDYVICDKNNIKPRVAIELDDKSHEQESRRKRDVEVERIFKEAKLPLLRFSNKEGKNPRLVKEQVQEHLV